MLIGGERRLEEIKRKEKDMTALILCMVELNVYYRLKGEQNQRTEI